MLVLFRLAHIPTTTRSYNECLGPARRIRLPTLLEVWPPLTLQKLAGGLIIRMATRRESVKSVPAQKSSVSAEAQHFRMSQRRCACAPSGSSERRPQ
jgi:hypothetical protein